MSGSEYSCHDWMDGSFRDLGLKRPCQNDRNPGSSSPQFDITEKAHQFFILVYQSYNFLAIDTSIFAVKHLVQCPFIMNLG